MEKIWRMFVSKWARRFTALFLVLGLAFFMATACNDDDCFFNNINFTPVEDEDECFADCEANFCDGCDFDPPDGCFGSDCEICVIIDDDDIL